MEEENTNAINKKVLVIFGSKSDKDVYKSIVHELDKSKVSHVLRVCSAHRTPDVLEEILKEDAEHDYICIIAGAGLAAHLPGVIASKITKPVIGVPVHSNYSGLDAFLSIIQMPPGIPVMAVGVNQAEVAAKNALKMKLQYEYVNIVAKEDNPLSKKAAKILDQFEATIKYSEQIDSDAINIKFVGLEEEVEESDALVIYCPASEERNNVEYAINLLKHTEHGLWVGLNRADNAAISAIEILNLDHRYDLMLEDFRKKQAEKVVKDDNEEKVLKVHDGEDNS